MGEIKNNITKLISESGSKFKAKKAAEEWFTKGKSSSKEKSVATVSKRFSAGKIYVFRYAPIGARDLPWFDKNPVVLALDPAGDNDVGINLNLLPIQVKEDLLDKVYGQFSAEIARRSTGPMKNDALKQMKLSINWNDAKGFLSKYTFAIRQYKPGRKSGQTVVSYENWAKIVLCDFADLNGTSYNQLRRLFENG
tara:strand:+ start:2175 stop:2759 length:585 start_codon:yes stop_codon:yes gene_type:complete